MLLLAAQTSNALTCYLSYSGKTVDEVWSAIKANQTQPNYEQPFTVGHLLEGIGVVSDSPRQPIQAAQLQFLQQFGHSQPEVRQPQMQQARLPDPPQLQIHSQGVTPSFSPAQYAAQQNQLSGRPALIQQQPLPQQFPQQQYIHPHHQQQQQLQQPLPAHQQGQQQPNQIAGRRTRSPTKPRSVGKVSPDKAQPSDNGAVNIRASTQYPPAQQASHTADATSSHANEPTTCMSNSNADVQCICAQSASTVNAHSLLLYLHAFISAVHTDCHSG